MCIPSSPLAISAIFSKAQEKQSNKMWRKILEEWSHLRYRKYASMVMMWISWKKRKTEGTLKMAFLRKRSQRQNPSPRKKTNKRFKNGPLDSGKEENKSSTKTRLIQDGRFGLKYAWGDKIWLRYATFLNLLAIFWSFVFLFLLFVYFCHLFCFVIFLWTGKHTRETTRINWFLMSWMKKSWIERLYDGLLKSRCSGCLGCLGCLPFLSVILKVNLLVISGICLTPTWKLKKVN